MRKNCYFFFSNPPTTKIYTLSLHDALPIWPGHESHSGNGGQEPRLHLGLERPGYQPGVRSRDPHSFQESQVKRSEEHTSELQSQSNIVCRLLLEKKKSSGMSRFRVQSYIPR